MTEAKKPETGAEPSAAKIPRELLPYLKELPAPVLKPGDDPELDAAVERLRAMNGSEDPLFYDVDAAGGAEAAERGIGNVRVYVEPTAPRAARKGAPERRRRRVAMIGGGLGLGLGAALGVWWAIRAMQGTAEVGDTVAGGIGASGSAVMVTAGGAGREGPRMEERQVDERRVGPAAGSAEPLEKAPIASVESVPGRRGPGVAATPIETAAPPRPQKAPPGVGTTVSTRPAPASKPAPSPASTSARLFGTES